MYFLLQSEIFKALERTRLLVGDIKESNYSRCGRTDKGVSSTGQVSCLSISFWLYYPCITPVVFGEWSCVLSYIDSSNLTNLEIYFSSCWSFSVSSVAFRNQYSYTHFIVDSGDCFVSKVQTQDSFYRLWSPC